MGFTTGADVSFRRPTGQLFFAFPSKGLKKPLPEKFSGYKHLGPIFTFSQTFFFGKDTIWVPHNDSFPQSFIFNFPTLRGAQLWVTRLPSHSYNTKAHHFRAKKPQGLSPTGGDPHFTLFLGPESGAEKPPLGTPFPGGPNSTAFFSAPLYLQGSFNTLFSSNEGKNKPSGGATKLFGPFLRLPPDPAPYKIGGATRREDTRAHSPLTTRGGGDKNNLLKPGPLLPPLLFWPSSKLVDQKTIAGTTVCQN